jgi:hypothetical protein
MLKNKIKDCKWVIIYFILTSIIVFLAYSFQIIGLIENFERGDHFNMITINSILSGFLFTGLGIIISGLDKEKILSLNIGGYLAKYYIQIYLTILFNIISIIASILIIFESRIKIRPLLYIEQSFIIIGIILFIKCMWDLIKLIRKMK